MTTEFTKDEALAFIDAMRRTIEGETGFKWYAEKLSDLSVYVEALADENERLRRAAGEE